MTISQFYVDTMQNQNLTQKTIEDKVLSDFNDVGDLIIIMSRYKSNPNAYKELGYLLQANPKIITRLKIRLIAFKLFLRVRFQKRISHADCP